MSQKDVIKLPRLYVDNELRESNIVNLNKDQAHYLLHVLRIHAGDCLRLFNGHDGEWRASVDSANKKGVSARIDSRIKEQPPVPRELHLFFAPIKKARMDWLIEKAVELGATHLHPVLTHNTEVRAINEERIRAQIIEAAEQCERMDLPELFSLQPVLNILSTLPLLACLERTDAKSLKESIPEKESVAFLIGPEGGFTEDEKKKLCGMKNVAAVSLGPRVLRSETAAIMALCAVMGVGP